jgi:hypothetical protein
MAVRDDFAPGEVLAAADLNDTFGSKPTRTVATTEPSNPVAGDLWFDSTDTPPTPYYYDGVAEEFVPFPSGVGNADFSDAATGTYTEDGIAYKYIVFNASGTLTVTEEGLADVLVVGGGGGGGNFQGAANFSGGGGGAGGHVYKTQMYVPAGSLTVTVGAGGSATTLTTSGSDSWFSDLVGVGGGCGSSGDIDFPQRGGSGGGGRNSASQVVSRTGAASVLNQGNNGGDGQATDNNITAGGGGGGGSSAVGGNGTTSVGGDGGAGTANAITGTSVTRAGGGGGARGAGSPGSGGAGGGGAGGTTTGTNGTANTGGGGGGAYFNNTAGNGGSGVVIVRVKV